MDIQTFFYWELSNLSDHSFYFFLDENNSFLSYINILLYEIRNWKLHLDIILFKSTILELTKIRFFRDYTMTTPLISSIAKTRIGVLHSPGDGGLSTQMIPFLPERP